MRGPPIYRAWDTTFRNIPLSWCAADGSRTFPACGITSSGERSMRWAFRTGNREGQNTERKGRAERGLSHAEEKSSYKKGDLARSEIQQQAGGKIHQQSPEEGEKEHRGIHTVWGLRYHSGQGQGTAGRHF